MYIKIKELKEDKLKYREKKLTGRKQKTQKKETGGVEKKI